MQANTKIKESNPNRKRILLILLALIVLLSVSIMGTLAYFTDKKDAENVFTVGKVEIELAEPNWKAKNYDTTPPVLVPGDAIDKDPTVTVKANSEACYVRLKVVMPEKLKAILQDLPIDAKYTKAAETTTAGFYTVYYNYNTLIAKNTASTPLEPLFTKITPKTDATDAEWQAVRDLGENNAKITITAEAIQSEGFDNATQAWAAFPTSP